MGVIVIEHGFLTVVVLGIGVPVVSSVVKHCAEFFHRDRRMDSNQIVVDAGENIIDRQVCYDSASAGCGFNDLTQSVSVFAGSADSDFVVSQSTHVLGSIRSVAVIARMLQVSDR